MPKRKTTQSKRFVTKDKQERFETIIADNKEFESLVGQFANSEPDKKQDSKQSASKVENNKNKDN
jgi:hypothetical protein